MNNKTRKLSLDEYIAHLKAIGCSEEELEIIRQKHTRNRKPSLEWNKTSINPIKRYVLKGIWGFVSVAISYTIHHARTQIFVLNAAKAIKNQKN